MARYLPKINYDSWFGVSILISVIILITSTFNDKDRGITSIKIVLIFNYILGPIKRIGPVHEILVRY